MKNINALLIVIMGSLQIGFSQTTNPIDTTKILGNLTAISTNTAWEEVNSGDGIFISYRNISMPDLFDTREIKVNFKVEGTTDSFLNYLINDSYHSLWNKGVKSISSFEKTDSTWISHLVYDIPFPLNKQDLIVMNKILENGKTTFVHVYSIPNYLAKSKNMDRIKHYLGTWKIEEAEGQTLLIEYKAVTISKSFIPKFLKDPLIQNNLLNSFKNLVSLTKEQVN